MIEDDPNADSGDEVIYDDSNAADEVYEDDGEIYEDDGEIYVED